MRQKAIWVCGGLAGATLIAIAVLVLQGGAQSSATAGSHAFMADRSLEGASSPEGGFEKACGVAVDSTGDRYVASSGGGAIDVFDVDGTYVGSIRDAGGPCGLAVDTGGNVYAVGARSGRVLRYEPNAYPFTGKVTYGRGRVIDASGAARGIAVDPVDDGLYVAEGDHVSVYGADGTLGQNEVQRVLPLNAGSGTFRLSLGGRQTAPIPYDATHSEVEHALERLPAIGAGNVVVREGPEGGRDHLVVFTGALARTELAPLVGDPSGLRGPRGATLLYVEGYRRAYSGRIGDGVLSEASGVGVYSRGEGEGSYLFVADSGGGGGDRIGIFAGRSARSMKLVRTVDGAETPGKSIGFGSAGASLGVDQRSGHFYVFDARHSVVDEFEASGAYVGQIRHASFQDARPTGIAVDDSGVPTDGMVYVTSGAGPGSEVLAFGPLGTAAREPLPAPLSFPFKGVCGTVVDSHGDLYVSGEAAIDVYDPNGRKLTRIGDRGRPCELAVDSEGNLYVSERGSATVEGRGEKIVMYRPDSYPVTASTEYNAPKTIVSYEGLRSRIAIDPANDRLFTSNGAFSIAEYGSAREGSRLISDEIGKGLLSGIQSYNGGLDVCGKTGEIFAAGRGKTGWRIYVLDPKGTRLLTEIDGSGSPRGQLEEHASNIALDQANCNVFVNVFNRAVEEYEASGTFVDEFAPVFPFVNVDIAVDNAPSSPNRRDVYVVGLDHVYGFGPVSYEAD